MGLQAKLVWSILERTRSLADVRRALSSLPGLVSMALGRRDGFPLWASGFREAHLRWVAATAAAVIGTAEATASHLGLPPSGKVLMSLGGKELMFLSCSNDLILILLFDERTDLDFAYERAKDLAPRLAASMESPKA